MTRVEDVDGTAFTEVMKTRKGKVVRADFDIVRMEEGERLMTWSQRVAGTPFASVLKSAETELRLTPIATSAAEAFAAVGSPGTDTPATEVTIELRQEMASGSGGGSGRYGWIVHLAPRFGGPMVRRAGERTLEDALAGLERISV